MQVKFIQELIPECVVKNMVTAFSSKDVRMHVTLSKRINNSKLSDAVGDNPTGQAIQYAMNSR